MNFRLKERLVFAEVSFATLLTIAAVVGTVATVGCEPQRKFVNVPGGVVMVQRVAVDVKPPERGSLVLIAGKLDAETANGNIWFKVMVEGEKKNGHIVVHFEKDQLVEAATLIGRDVVVTSALEVPPRTFVRAISIRPKEQIKEKE